MFPSSIWERVAKANRYNGITDKIGLQTMKLFFTLMLLVLTTLPSGACVETPSKRLFVVFIGGINSDPTAAQMAGTAQRGVGNSGMFQLATDLRQDGASAEYFNWNGSAAGKIKEQQAPLSKGIAEQIRKRHVDRPKDKLALVGNSWGGHTAWEVSQLLAEEPAVPVDLIVFLDPSSAGRFDKAQPENLPSNVKNAVTIATRNALGWKKWADEPRAEFVDLGDPANGFLKKRGPAYDSLFDVKAHIAAEWDPAIHKSIQSRLLKLVMSKTDKDGSQPGDG